MSRESAKSVPKGVLTRSAAAALKAREEACIQERRLATRRKLERNHQPQASSSRQDRTQSEARAVTAAAAASVTCKKPRTRSEVTGRRTRRVVQDSKSQPEAGAMTAAAAASVSQESRARSPVTGRRTRRVVQDSKSQPEAGAMTAAAAASVSQESRARSPVTGRRTRRVVQDSKSQPEAGAMTAAAAASVSQESRARSPVTGRRTRRVVQDSKSQPEAGAMTAAAAASVSQESRARSPVTGRRTRRVVQDSKSQPEAGAMTAAAAASVSQESRARSPVTGRRTRRVVQDSKSQAEAGAMTAAAAASVSQEPRTRSEVTGRRTRRVVQDSKSESETGASPAAAMAPVEDSDNELRELSSIIGPRTRKVGGVFEDTMFESETGASPAAAMAPVEDSDNELRELSSIIGPRTRKVGGVFEDTMFESETGASPAAAMAPVEDSDNELRELSSIIGPRTRKVGGVFEDTMFESETGASPAAAMAPVEDSDNELRELSSIIGPRTRKVGGVFEDTMFDSPSRAPTPEPVRQFVTSTPAYDIETLQSDLVVLISSDDSFFVIEESPNPARPSLQRWSVGATCNDSTLTESGLASPEPVPGPSRARASSSASEPDDIAWEDICRVGTEQTTTRGRRNDDLDSEIILNAVKQLYDTYSTRPHPIRCADQPPTISTRMMPHQLEALAWMRWRESKEHPGGILADDMGLGKTLCAVALIASSSDRASMSPRPSRPAGGTLVVCPVALLQHWRTQLRTHCAAQLRVVVHHGPRRPRDEMTLAEAAVVITTYAVLQKESSVGGALTLVKWHRAILDEAHAVRNSTSATAKAAASLHAKHRWCVTGTPLQNKTTDLFSLVYFLGITPFDDLRVWNTVFKPHELAGCRRLEILLRTIAFRRTKENLKVMGQIASLPPKENHEWLFELTDAERTVYDSLQAKASALYTRYLRRRASSNESMDTESLDSSGSLPSEHEGCAAKTQDMLIMLLRLRQICCHCALLPNVSEEDDSCVSEAVRQLMTAPDPNGVFQKSTPSAKIQKTLELVNDVLQRGEKIVLISQWTSFLSIVKLHLDSAQIKSVVYTGKLSVQARQCAVNNFNNHPSGPNVMLLSLSAGGVGINLCGANHLLLLDPHWNPQLEEQARARIHRVGQTRPVHMHRLIAARTVEERVVWLQQKKLQLAETLLSAAEVRDAPALTTDDLTRLLLGGN